MNILMLNYEYPPLGGGAANATKHILQEFSEQEDIQVDLITSSTDQAEVRELAPNVQLHFLDIGKKGNLHYQSNKDLLSYSWRAYGYAKKLMRQKKYDLVHAFFGIPCGFVAMQLGLPYIVSLRGSDVPFYNERFEKLDKLIFQRLSKRIWRKSKATIANSKGLKDLALESAPTQAIGVIVNGVDTVKFAPATNKQRQENAPIVLISTGRLIQRKGYNFMIDALAHFDKSKFELRLIGDGNVREELELQAKEKGVNVQFLGKQAHDNIPKLLNQSDVFVLPSLNEGMSNSILEAMASGLPIITTDTGGSDELIKGNGFLVEKSSVEAIKNVLQKYLNQPELLLHQGSESRSIAEKMNWNSVSQAYMEAYQTAIRR